MLTNLVDVTRKRAVFFPPITLNPSFYFFIALLCFLFMSWFDESYYHADEHFQILEMATYQNHANLFGTPWEFAREIRPTIQNWYVISLLKLGTYFVTYVSPFFINFLSKASAALLSAISCYVFYLSFQNELVAEEHKKWFFLFTFFNYITFTHAAHFSSETISTDFFMLGLSILFAKPINMHRLRYLGIGFLFGAAIITRYQIGIMVLGLVTWQIAFQKIPTKHLSLILLGIGCIFICGTLLDSLFYGHFVCTAWRYFYVNLIENVAAEFGTSHWTYSALFWQPPFGPLYVLGIAYFMIKRPKHVLTWVILPFLFVHQMIGHKEIRFLFPVLEFTPFMLMYALQIVQNNKNNTFNPQKWFSSLWYLNTAFILIYILSHYDLYNVYHYFWKNYQNQPVTLYRYSSPEFPLNHGLPLEYYLPHTMHLKKYSKTSSHTKDGALQFLFLNCTQDLPAGQPAKLIYDACPHGAWGMLYRSFKWTKRSQIFRHQGRVYQV